MLKVSQIVTKPFTRANYFYDQQSDIRIENSLLITSCQNYVTRIKCISLVALEDRAQKHQYLLGGSNPKPRNIEIRL